jgi:hypothetical protein
MNEEEELIKFKEYRTELDKIGDNLDRIEYELNILEAQIKCSKNIEEQFWKDFNLKYNSNNYSQSCINMQEKYEKR